MRHYIIIDDDATNNLICRLMITKYDPGAIVQLFQSPEEALDLILNDRNLSFGTIFLDNNMPTMTGWEFLEVFAGLKEEIRRRYDIYMLSSSFESSNYRIKDFPFLSGFFSKPLKAEYLRQIQDGQLRSNKNESVKIRATEN